MKRDEIEALRADVSCEALLEKAGYEIDMNESTRRAMKYRRGSDIVIVTHSGRGWFDPHSDHKGDVFSLAMVLEDTAFPAAVEAVSRLVGFQFSRPAWTSPGYSKPIRAVGDRWRVRPTPSPGSNAWRYLCLERFIPSAIIQHAIQDRVLREGPFGSMWAAHHSNDARIAGWEERGPDWRGFATGGTKILFRLGPSDATRLCVTEAAIDAMSLAAIEGMRAGTLYVSTGGGWSPATEDALAVLAKRDGFQIVAATDANSQGETYAHRLRVIAARAGCDWQRLRPPAEDWNEVLKSRETGKKGR